MKYIILGGTGTLGQEISRQLLLKESTQLITIFSRSELKQKIMRGDFPSSKIRFVIGDIRDFNSVVRAMKGHEIGFHVAALKHIDTIEENPEESVKTNIEGTINAANAAETLGIESLIFSSTDKAVDPINVYGMCKGISEKILLRRNRWECKPRFMVYRWGNVLGSSGSLLHIIDEKVKTKKQIPITDFEMTRFWILIQDAVKYMLTTYETANPNYVHFPPLKAASVDRLIKSYLRVHQKCMDYPLKNIGIRLGEKLHERMGSIHSINQMTPDSQFWSHYTDEELDEMVTLTLGVK